MIEDVCIVNGEWVAVTGWYEPHQKPERVGLYQALVYDAGWTYEWLVWWDGRHWRSSVDGNTLIDQNLKWRGLTVGPSDE